MTPRRFPIRFTGLNHAMVMLGIVPSKCRVAIDEAQVSVHLAWAFQMYAPLTSVRGASIDHAPVRGWGAHGWRGTWLVNGSSSGIVRVELDPPGRGFTMGIPVTVRVLRVAVDDPDGLIDALGRASSLV